MGEFENLDKKIGNTPLKPHKTYTLQSKELFYLSVPANYRMYYQRFVKEWFKWYDGYVDWFHAGSGEHGVFSSRIAKTIAHKFAKQITGGKLLYEEDSGGKQAKDKIIKLLEKKKFDNKLAQAFEWALAGGDAVLKVDVYKLGDPSIVTLRKDEYFLDTNFDGEITRFTTLIDTRTRTTNANGKETKENYYLVEERKYNEKTDNPEYRLAIKQGYADGVNYRKGNFHSADIDFRNLPNKVRDDFKKEFPTTTFGKWEEMGINDLGVYLIKASEGTSFQPTLPFGESIFSNMIHLLMSYDFYYSAKMTDVYLGRGKVIVPDTMKSPHESGETYYSTMSDLEYARVPYKGSEEQAPIPLQFDLRSQDWTSIRNDLLQEMSLALNLSPRTVASFAVPASEKPTAHEINVDQDDTALTIEYIRKLNEGTINELINTLCNYMGLDEDMIKVKFSKMGLMNMSTMVNQISMLKDRNLIDDRTALEYVFPDKTDKDIDRILEAKKKEQEEKTVNNVPNPNDKELENKEKATFDNQVTHTEKAPKEENGEE